jgi:rubrerythrin
MMGEGDIVNVRYPVKWKCTRCNFIISVTETPDKVCPNCKHEAEFEAV